MYNRSTPNQRWTRLSQQSVVSLENQSWTGLGTDVDGCVFAYCARALPASFHIMDLTGRWQLPSPPIAWNIGCWTCNRIVNIFSSSFGTCTQACTAGRIPKKVLAWTSAHPKKIPGTWWPASRRVVVYSAWNWCRRPQELHASRSRSRVFWAQFSLKEQAFRSPVTHPQVDS